MLPGFTKWSQISGNIVQGERQDLQATYYNIYIIIVVYRLYNISWDNIYYVEWMFFAHPGGEVC